jgi:Flp pilus assembly protein CpaB
MRTSTAQFLALLNRWPRRLAVLGLLVLAAGSALAAHRPAAARQGSADAPVTVAARTMPAGTTLAARDLQVTRWPPGLIPERSVASPSAIIGRRLAGPVTAGEPLTSARLVGAGLSTALSAGLVASSVPVASDVAGFVRAGDRVDLLAPPVPVEVMAAEAAPAGVAARGPTGEARVVAENVLVLAVLPAQPDGATSGAALVIASDRRTALRVAAVPGRVLLAVVADPP